MYAVIIKVGGRVRVALPAEGEYAGGFPDPRSALDYCHDIIDRDPNLQPYVAQLVDPLEASDE